VPDDPPCDTGGEQYDPSAVEIVLGRPRIVLQGPGRRGRERPQVRAPTAADLYGKGKDWNLDFPGSPFEPGCTYARDAIALGQGRPPVAYAHIVAQEGVPGRLALQYWFFYYFNQFNDLHEGDWEMVQLVFAADTPAEALEQEPISVGYSQHDGGERASWDDDKLERSGDHPVVYAAAGSHANYYSSHLWLGRSASEGFGCDDTSGRMRRVQTQARLVREPRSADDRDAWLAFEGNWGQKARGLFNAPTGPNTNRKWSRPIAWDEGLRGSSISVPGEGVVGVSVTGFFCDAVAEGSQVYADLLSSPLSAALGFVVVGLVIAGTARLTRWSPVELRPLRAPRAGGQVVRVARRIWRRRLGLLTGIGLIFVPLAALGSAIQAGFFQIPTIRAVQDFDGGEGQFTLPIALIVGGVGSLFAYVVMTAATAEGIRRADAGEDVSPWGAYRALLPRWTTLVGALAMAAAAVLLLFLSIIGIPWAIRQAVRWVFIPQVSVFEETGARGCLRRSSELVRGRWWRTAALAGVLIVIGLATGLAAGLLLLLFTSAPLPLVNFVGSLVYVVALPYVAVALTLAYGDRVARGPAVRRRRRWTRPRRRDPGAAPS
jgi:hypothetical protein